MRTSDKFWVVTILRGLLAVFLATSILVVPDLARTPLLASLAEDIAVLSLVIYGVLDSTLVLISSRFVPIPSIKPALRIQSICGLCIGVLFWFILFDKLELHWFLYLIAVQAAATSYAEHAIARHTSKANGSSIFYLGAWVTLFAAIAYACVGAFASGALTTREISYAAYAYLGAFGVSQAVMAGSALYRGERPGRLRPV